MKNRIDCRVFFRWVGGDECDADIGFGALFLQVGINTSLAPPFQESWVLPADASVPAHGVACFVWLYGVLYCGKPCFNRRVRGTWLGTLIHV